MRMALNVGTGMKDSESVPSCERRTRHESSLKGEPLGKTSNPRETAILSGCGLFGVVYYSSCSGNKTYTNKIILCVCVHIMCACMLSHFSCVQLFGTLWTVAYQTHLSIGFSKQEYWNGFICPPPGNLPEPEIKAMSLFFFFFFSSVSPLFLPPVFFFVLLFSFFFFCFLFIYFFFL